MSPMPKKRAERKLEISTVHKDIQRVLNQHGWFWWKPKSNMFGTAGISDFHAVKNRLFMTIEAKRGTGKPAPTANQIAFLQNMRDAGHFAFVVNETRVKHLDAFLTSFEIATQAQQAKKEVPPEHGAQMINCIREMQQEI